MKVFSVCGFTSTGKTTTVEGIIKELKKRNYSVGSIKDIHFEGFKIDKEGSNSYKHRMAGAEWLRLEGFMKQIYFFLGNWTIWDTDFYDVDYLVIEGMSDANIPHIFNR